MPALLTSLTAVERLAAHVNALPEAFSKALGEDLEYARLGAALTELPYFGGWTLGLESWLGRAEPPRFSKLLASRGQLSFGVKAAELVSNGALVGVEPGLAFIAGYFTELCVARALDPVVRSLIPSQRKGKEKPHVTRSRIEWAQSLLLMQELHGSTLVGTPAVRSKLHIRKGNLLKGMGRGMYELIRVSSIEALDEPLTNAEVGSWTRGFAFFSLAIGSPLGKLKALPSLTADKSVYRAPGIDVFATVDRGIEATRRVLTVVGTMIQRNSFSPRARARLAEVFEEGEAAIT